MQSTEQNLTTILVTGGAGYIGSHMVWALLNQRTEAGARMYNVVVFDNFSLGYTYPVSQHLGPQLINKEFSESGEGKGGFFACIFEG